MKVIFGFVAAFILLAAFGLGALAFIYHATHAQQPVPVVCQQYDIFNLSNGQLVPNPSMPLWLRHQAALRDHCPVDPAWGTLPSDHQNIS